MVRRNRKTSIIQLILAASLLCLAYFLYLNEKPGLRFEVEGLYIDKNFRDVGKSMNQCLREEQLGEVYKEELLYRSNKWFSGWSCADIGDPDAIITLNHQPERRWRYYCRKGDGEKIIGSYANRDFELNNIEYLETWGDHANRQAICDHISSVLNALSAQQRTLFHCEAGRDRTGAMATIVSAIVYENLGNEINEKFSNALECDYRKSPSLKSHKHGRVKDFVDQMIAESSSVTSYIEQKCQLDRELITRAAKSFGHVSL